MTCLKQRLLAHYPNMCTQHQGHSEFLAFNEDFGDVLAKACELDRDLDAVPLMHAAQTVRRHITGGAEVFNGFPAQCQQDAVSLMLPALVSLILERPSISLILEGPSIKNQSDSTALTTLTIAQLIMFNSLKHLQPPKAVHLILSGTTPCSSHLHQPHATCTHMQEGAC